MIQTIFHLTSEPTPNKKYNIQYNMELTGDPYYHDPTFESQRIKDTLPGMTRISENIMTRLKI